jgi:hypothetical protein
VVLTAVQPLRKEYALGACERSFRAGIITAGKLLGERAFSMLLKAEKQSSDDYVSLANTAFINQFYEKLADRAGQAAIDLDPNNSLKKSFHKNATAARIIEDRGLEVICSFGNGWVCEINANSNRSGLRTFVPRVFARTG